MLSLHRHLFSAVFVGILLATPARAQDAKTLAKAERLIAPGAPAERAQKALHMLDHAIGRGEATPEGHWMRGDALALLALAGQDPGKHAREASEAYAKSVETGSFERDLTILASLEAHLKSAGKVPAGATPDAAKAALVAAKAYLQLDDVRRDLSQSSSVDRARRYMLCIRTALAAGAIGDARDLFTQLEAMGGFMEDLAIVVSQKVAAQEGPQEAFLFLGPLVLRHPTQRDLLDEYLRLCLANGWDADARKALDNALEAFRDTYDDQLALARYLRHLDDRDGAIEHYKSALRHAQRGYDANWELQMLLRDRAAEQERKGATGKALESYEQALTAVQLVLEPNPENTSALEAREVLEGSIAALKSVSPAPVPAPAASAPAPAPAPSTIDEDGSALR